MNKIEIAIDINGRDMRKGDTVTTIGSMTSARIADLAEEGEEQFVSLRPVHQPYGKGVWHSADRVQWVAAGKKTKKLMKDRAEARAEEAEEAGRAEESKSEAERVVRSAPARKK